jgi:transposase
MVHDVERRAIVQFLAKEGWPISAISRATNYPYNFCYRWAYRSDTHRYPGSGRPVKLTAKLIDIIRRKLKRHGGTSSTREVAAEVGLSHDSVARAAKQAGVVYRSPRSVPAITEAQAEARI